MKALDKLLSRILVGIVFCLPFTGFAESQDHWAFQPIQRPEVPVLKDFNGASIQPLDAFILDRLQEEGLKFSPKADRRTLVRRYYYAIIGLPPTLEEMTQWMSDEEPLWSERLVDHILNQPAFGEHWARRWLDIARYSDTKGYVYGREEKNWPHAWVYRDWVIQAFNDDMPYDRFLKLQLAADQIVVDQNEDLAAMGFLTVGRRFLGVRPDIIDDQIDVVTRGMLGLTVSCARCHDHKYDPIPTADYYSLYGVFDNSVESLIPLASNPRGLLESHHERALKLEERLAAEKLTAGKRARSRLTDYLLAQLELEKYPPAGFDQIFQKEDILPAFVHAWRDRLRDAGEDKDPVFARWHAYNKLPKSDFSKNALEVDFLFQSGSQSNRWIELAFMTPPLSFEEVVRRYGAVFDWVVEVTDQKKEALSGSVAFNDPDLEALRQLLFDPGSPCVVPQGGIVHTEFWFDTDTINALWGMQKELDLSILNSPEPVRVALGLEERRYTEDPRIFLRGDPMNQGVKVSRHFLSALKGSIKGPFENGSGRLELAEAIVSPDNPLTSRVIVNRIWGFLMGQGLVPTPSDFGTRADPPSHPELLDWLANDFMEHGWSLKSAIRQIVLSETFQQSSKSPGDPYLMEKAMQLDPENRWLWKMNARRLTFEEIRDSLFQLTSNLDRQTGGRPVDIFSAPFNPRRAVYGKVDRQFVSSELRVFDFANPDLHIAQRSETTVPQQALFFINHPLALDRSRALAKVSAGNEFSDTQRIREMFRRALQREPSETELAESLEWVSSTPREMALSVLETARDWTYGTGKLEESNQQILNFTPLPHFNGRAWQGGSSWPDKTWGWAQLTADGGHPGNTRDHAVVRRWTAPEDMVVQIQSILSHQSQPGDGIRAFVVHSSKGILDSITIHVDEADLNQSSINMREGETLDFLVDIGDVLNSDEFIWKIQINEMEVDKDVEASAAAKHWDSVRDFPKNRLEPLTPWEQLAQALLCSNEFLFID